MDINALKLLKKELTSRKSRNKNYSLRSFARSLDVSPSRLSEILSGQPMSLKMASKIANKLELEDAVKAKFLASIDHQSRTFKRRNTPSSNADLSVSLSLEEIRGLIDNMHELSQSQKNITLKITLQ